MLGGALGTLSGELAEVRDLQRDSKHEDALAALHGLPASTSEMDNAYRAIFAAISETALGELQRAEAAVSLVKMSGLDTDALAEQKSPLMIDYAHFLLLSGDLKNAMNTARTHLIHFPDDPFGHGRLGTYSALADKLDDAKTHLELATELEPDRLEWHNNLAGVYLRLGLLREAVQAYDQALTLDPSALKPKNSRALTLHALGETQTVVEQFQKDFDKDPTSVTARRALARAHALDDEPSRAIALIAEALTPLQELLVDQEHVATSDTVDQLQFSNSPQFEDQVALRVTLLELFSERASFMNALKVINQILKLDPKHKVTFIARKITLLVELENRTLARKLLDKAKADDAMSNDVGIRRVEAMLLGAVGDYEGAEAIQRDLVAAYPGDAQLQAQLAQSLMWIGRLDEAAEILEAAARLNPQVLAQLVNTGNLPADPDALQRIQRLANNYLLPDVVRAAMAFAAAAMLDKSKDYDEAFEALHTANGLINKSIGWKNETSDTFIEKTVTVYSETYFSDLPAIRKTSRQPVFIVGMPRSGTTLLEQILSAHPDVFAAGEQPIIPRMGRLLKKILKRKEPYPFELSQFTPELREDAARHYLWCIEEFNDKAPYIVDKLPHNFVHLGLIYSIFPEAKVINIIRDPRDIAISNYQQNFTARHGGMGYAFNLGNIASEINRYYTIMDHWEKVLPEKPCTLKYEDLVANQRVEMGRVLDYLGLDWIDDMTEFHKVERAVRTASVAQVRSKLYDSSAQKWRRYERHLDEFLEVLNPEILARWEDNL